MVGHRLPFRTEGRAALDQQEHKFEIDECTACEKKFDKSTPDSVEWRVIVRKDDEGELTARFYCPECWSAAEQFIRENVNG